jgi:DNA-binding winged helix-turn-helix (wHTH) protein
MDGPTRRVRLVRFSVFELDLDSGELFKQGRKVKLQGQPFDLLVALLERPGEVVTREELQQKVWPADTVVDFDLGLNRAINKVRDALGDSAESPRFIETLPRRGYRFIGQIQAETDPEPQAFEAEPVGPEPALGVAGTGMEPVESGETVAPVPKTASPRLRGRLWLAGGCVIAVVLATGLWPIDVPQVERVVQLTNDTTLKQVQGSMISDGNRVLYASIDSAWWVPASGGEPRRLSLPTPGCRCRLSVSYSPARREVLITGSDGLWLVGTDGESPHKIGDFRPGDGQVVLAPDAERLAVFAPDGIYIQSIQGGERKKVHPMSEKVYGLFMSEDKPAAMWWHPSGHSVGFLDTPGDSSKIRAWQVDDDGMHLRRIVPEREQEQGPGAWSQDGRRFFYTAEGEVFVRSQAGFLGWMRKAVVTRLTTSGQFRTPPVVDPANPRRLYEVGTVLRGQTMRYDLKAQHWVPFLGAFSGELIERSPDGQSMIYKPFPGLELHRCGIDGSSDILLTPGVEVLNPKWSPDGKRIAFAGRPKGTFGRYKLWLVSSAGGDAAPYRPEIESVWDATWSGDGKRLLLGQQLAGDSSRRSIRILHLETGKLESVPGTENLFAPHWSPDEKQMLALDADTWQPRIFDTVKGAWRPLLEQGIGDPIWSRDGKYIYAEQNIGKIVGLRIEVATGRREEIARPDFEMISNGSYGVDWTRDMEPLILRDLSSTQIYRIDLDR